MSRKWMQYLIYLIGSALWWWFFLFGFNFDKNSEVVKFHNYELFKSVKVWVPISKWFLFECVAA